MSIDIESSHRRGVDFLNRSTSWSTSDAEHSFRRDRSLGCRGIPLVRGVSGSVRNIANGGGPNGYTVALANEKRGKA